MMAARMCFGRDAMKLLSVPVVTAFIAAIISSSVLAQQAPGAILFCSHSLSAGH
jgi:hypothetical protein